MQTNLKRSQRWVLGPIGGIILLLLLLWQPLNLSSALVILVAVVGSILFIVPSTHYSFELNH